MTQAFVFKVRLTPKGKHYVQLLQGDQVVAVSKKTYGSGEEAICDMQAALEQLKLAESIVRVNSHGHAQ